MLGSQMQYMYYDFVCMHGSGGRVERETRGWKENRERERNTGMLHQKKKKENIDHLDINKILHRKEDKPHYAVLGNK